MSAVRNPKTKLLIIILAVCAGALLTYFYLKNSKGKTLQYVPVKVERGSIVTTVLSTGTVNPENRVEVKPPIAGRAESVLVKEGDHIKRGQTLVLMSSTERAALLDAARARGKEELKKWEELYRATPILAPVAGTIIQRQIEPGQTFAVSDSILVISDRLIVEAQVDETDLARIKVGQRAEIVLDAYPDRPIEAKVGSIAYESTKVNNVTTYVVKTIPNEEPNFMRSGMTANVRFEIESRIDTLVVPSEVIKVEGGQTFVFKEGQTPDRPRKELVTTGLSDGKQTEILSGVEEGEVLFIPQVITKDGGNESRGTNPFGPPSRPRRR